MKILDKYLLKTFAGTFASVFVILFFIFILQTVWLFISELAGKDLDLILVVKFLLFAMPRIIPLVLPLSVLLASIMTFGSLAENYEFAAMKSSGISLQRAMKGLTIFIFVLSICAFVFANNVIPYAEYKFINFRKDIAQMKPAMAIAEGQFSDVGTYNIKVNKKSGENGNILHGITIHKKTNMFDGTKNVIRAKDGELVSNENSNILKLVLNDGYYYEDIVPKKYEEKKKLPFAKSSFKQYIINLDLSKLNNAQDPDYEISNTNTMLNINELRYTLDSLNRSYKKDVISFGDNIYQRTGINYIRTAVHTPDSLAKKLPPNNQSLLTGYSNADKAEILKVAIGNLSSAKYSIEGTKIELEGKQKTINSHWIAFYDKFVIAYACLLMFFIGAPLGAIIRKGGLGLPIVFAVLIFILYHFINTFGKKVAQENGIPPFLGCTLSSLLLTPLAILLTHRATNDMSITLNFDWITAPFQKLFGKTDRPKVEIVDLQRLVIEQDEEWKTLNASTDHALINIVKNARQFNYSPDFRYKALSVLEQRGITQDELARTGNLFNEEFGRMEEAKQLYHLYTNVALATNILGLAFSIAAKSGKGIFIILGLVNIVIFYVSLYKSNENLSEIEKIADRKIGVNSIVLFFFGFPFYFIMYFYNKSAIKEALAGYSK